MLGNLFKRDLYWIGILGVIVIIFYNYVLFTNKIINASDVITQVFWSAKEDKDKNVFDYIQSISDKFRADWYPGDNGGRTAEGGWNLGGLLFYRNLIYMYFPFPASIAWQAVLALLWGGIGAYYYCRQIGIGKFGSFAAGLVFALCTENASLINAGHIGKIETISWLPWVFLFLEKSLRSGRLFHYAMTSLMLAIQFAAMHWQISFYTCLAVGAYWLFHIGAGFLTERKSYLQRFRKDFLLASIMVILFFTTTAMSFVPLFSFSEQSERGGGMSQEEGMSWSMPHEETLTYFIPGLVGYSRQEASHKPTKDQVYYWGRMYFTQTNDYLGLLPWLLLPLPFILRRDRYTWFMGFLMCSTLIMAFGRYTPVYQFIFDYLPGFSTFRVPKMILFLFAFASAVLMGMGVDLLLDETIERRRLRSWMIGISVFVIAIGISWIFLAAAKDTVLSLFSGMIGRATRYQSGSHLIALRYSHMVSEAGIAFGIACVYLAILFAWFKRWLPSRFALPLLMLLLVGDLWRVNERFFVLTSSPEADKKAAKNDVVEFLEKNAGNYRVQPLDGMDAYYYSSYGLHNISAYVTVSEKRYKEFMEYFDFASPMADIINLKYVVASKRVFEGDKGYFSVKYNPVYYSPKENQVVLENRTVLPKAWLVPSVMTVTDGRQRLIHMNSPYFNPASVGLVESAPPIPLVPPEQARDAFPGTAAVEKYEANRIVINAAVRQNALLVIGEKYYRWWFARVDGKKAEIYPVDHILRGVYLTPGDHRIEFYFDPLTFKIGKYLTLSSFAFFIVMLGREVRLRKWKP